MVGLIAFGSPAKSVIDPKVYESKFKTIYSTFGTVTNPATLTRSMGLPADLPKAGRRSSCKSFADESVLYIYYFKLEVRL
jgi:hypothetical protein